MVTNQFPAAEQKKTAHHFGSLVTSHQSRLSFPGALQKWFQFHQFNRNSPSNISPSSNDPPVAKADQYTPLPSRCRNRLIIFSFRIPLFDASQVDQMDFLRIPLLTPSAAKRRQEHRNTDGTKYKQVMASGSVENRFFRAPTAMSKIFQWSGIGIFLLAELGFHYVESPKRLLS